MSEEFLSVAENKKNLSFMKLFMTMAFLFLLAVTTFSAFPNSPATSSTPPATKEDGWEKYGITEIPTPQETEQDQKYGGYPNNRLFNNDTKCARVVTLFNKPGMNPSNSQMVAFLSYAKMKLAETDVLEVTINKTPSLLNQIGLATWEALPAMYPAYCRLHLNDTLDNATSAVYEGALTLR